MNIEIIKASIDQKPIIANLLESYAYDFTEFWDFDIGEDGFYGYKYLPLYFIEATKYPYIIYVNKKIAGFILMQQKSPISDDEKIWDISEFFIMRKYRKQVIGTKAIFKIWNQFKGKWQVRVLEDNLIANGFWIKAIEKFTSDIFETNESTIDNDNWIIYSFESM